MFEKSDNNIIRKNEFLVNLVTNIVFLSQEIKISNDTWTPISKTPYMHPPEIGLLTPEVQKGVEHGSMDRNDQGGWIWDRSTALIAFSVNRYYLSNVHGWTR